MPSDRAVSTLDDSLKAALVAPCAAPSVKPFNVTESSAVPVAAPLVMRTIAALLEVAGHEEVAVKAVIVVEMELTVPKK